METFSICKQLTVALYGYNRKLLRFISSECEHIKISINATNEVSGAKPVSSDHTAS